MNLLKPKQHDDAASALDAIRAENTDIGGILEDDHTSVVPDSAFVEQIEEHRKRGIEEAFSNPDPSQANKLKAMEKFAANPDPQTIKERNDFLDKNSHK